MGKHNKVVEPKQFSFLSAVGILFATVLLAGGLFFAGNFNHNGSGLLDNPPAVSTTVPNTTTNNVTTGTNKQTTSVPAPSVSTPQGPLQPIVPGIQRPTQTGGQVLPPNLPPVPVPPVDPPGGIEVEAEVAVPPLLDLDTDIQLDVPLLAPLTEPLAPILDPLTNILK